MSMNLVTLLYLVASVCFIQALTFVGALDRINLDLISIPDLYVNLTIHVFQTYAPVRRSWVGLMKFLAQFVAQSRDIEQLTWLHAVAVAQVVNLSVARAQVSNLRNN